MRYGGLQPNKENMLNMYTGNRRSIGTPQEHQGGEEAQVPHPLIALILVSWDLLFSSIVPIVCIAALGYTLVSGVRGDLEFLP